MKLSQYIRKRAEQYAALETERNRIHGELRQAEAEEQRKAPLVDKAVSAVDDKMVSEIAELLPVMKLDGSAIEAGKRYYFPEDAEAPVKRAAVTLWDTEANTPQNAPDLWEDIFYKDGIRVIPAVLTVGTSFGLGEVGWWEGALVESLYSNNVWTPADAPDMWVEHESVSQK